MGYALNFVQEHYYITRVEKKGAEARLYARESVTRIERLCESTLIVALLSLTAMFAGVALACGCFIYAWTSESGSRR